MPFFLNGAERKPSWRWYTSFHDDTTWTGQQDVCTHQSSGTEASENGGNYGMLLLEYSGTLEPANVGLILQL